MVNFLLEGTQPLVLTINIKKNIIKIKRRNKIKKKAN